MALQKNTIASETHQDRTFIYRVQDGLLVDQLLAKSGQSTSFSRFITSLFLPEGYPNSVSGDYLAYQFWDTVQAFCSSISGQLSTQAVLQGVGVGNQAATPLAAALTWTLRDGAGMLGRILFAWYKSSSLDNDPRFWRLIADGLNDLALMLDILSPAFPKYVMLILCISSVFKAIVGVAGGASRVALTQHQARRNNTADVAAKDGSQETAVNLIALVSGLTLLPILEGQSSLIWAVFLLMTVGHVVANYLAVKSVVMEAFNEQRIDIVVDELLKTGRVLSPNQAAQREKLYYNGQPIQLAARLNHIAKTASQLDDLRASNKHGKFMIGAIAGSSETRLRLGVVFRKDANISDWMIACVIAHVVIKVAQIASQDRVTSLSEASQHLAKFAQEKNINKLVEASGAFVNDQDILQKFQDAGWNVSYFNFHSAEWRADW